MRRKLLKDDQRGFGIIEILIIVVLVIGIASLAIWRIQSNKKEKENANKQAYISGPLVAEDQLALEKKQANTSASSEATAEQNPAAGSATTPPTSSRVPAATSVPAGRTDHNANAPATPASGDTGTATHQSPSGITRPTAEFCKQQNGNSFTNAWTTDNRSHTYQVYENGVPVNKTGTGTAALNYDTMQTVAILPYLTQPAWSICSDKAGYIMVYYKPSGSVHTYNWLVPFEHISLTRP